jgi:hypothetical protein
LRLSASFGLRLSASFGLRLSTSFGLRLSASFGLLSHHFGTPTIIQFSVKQFLTMQ